MQIKRNCGKAVVTLSPRRLYNFGETLVIHEHTPTRVSTRNFPWHALFGTCHSLFCCTGLSIGPTIRIIITIQTHTDD